jgi:hypothetical protein
VIRENADTPAQRVKGAFAAALLAALLLLAIGVWLARNTNGGDYTPAPEGPAPALAPSGATEVASAIYRSYANVRELDDHSSVVLRGTALRRLPAYADRGSATSSAVGKSREILLNTVVVFRVDNVVRGNPDIEGKRIEVVHPGGRRRGRRLVIEGEPISRPGKTYVLFLRKKGGRYVIVGGPQGRYVVKGGRLRLISRDFSTAPVPKKLRGLRLSTFERTYPDLLRARFGNDPDAQPLPEEPLAPTPTTSKPSAPAGPPPPP